MFYLLNIVYWILDFWQIKVYDDFIDTLILAQIIVINGLWFYAYNEKTLMTRSVCVSYMYYSVYNLLATLFFVQTEYSVIYNTCLFFVLVNYQVYKSYSLPNDKINPENVCLAFYKPKTFWQYTLSLFGSPVSSPCLILGDKNYRLSKTEINPIIDNNEISEDYAILDTGVKITEEIIEAAKLIKNQPVRNFSSLYLRLNCVRILKPVLSEMPRKWRYRFMDWLPAIYLSRRLEWSKKC